MQRNSTWQRVSRKRPCPICEKSDWCLYTGESSNPDAAICQRIESAKRCGEAGWLHRLRDDNPTRESWRRSIRVPLRATSEPSDDKVDFAKLAADCQFAPTPDAVAKLATDLGVSETSLHRLSVGWSEQHGAWTFPMQDVHDNVLGIRLRFPDGQKLSISGGKEGLFIPGALDRGGLLLIAEGPTDTAALLDLGFSAVGRPSCSGGVRLLTEFVQVSKPSGVAIVSDVDTNGVGQRGAEALEAVLLAYSQTVRIIAPPSGAKDAREWKRSGATAADVQQAIDAAPVRKLEISIHRKAGRNGK